MLIKLRTERKANEMSGLERMWLIVGISQRLELNEDNDEKETEEKRKPIPANTSLSVPVVTV
jgi:hypothetical protein